VPSDDEWIHDRRRQLGDQLRERRLYANLTQEALADLTGIDRRTLQRFERGTSDPTYGRLLRIARALAVRVEDLVRE
jgi:transcriptional regulator with XRE-family HTH domain